MAFDQAGGRGLEIAEDGSRHHEHPTVALVTQIGIGPAQGCGRDVENAPASWLIGYLRTLPRSNCQWHWGDLWQEKLAQYDVVYAFLSPAAMPGLWAKIEDEMRAGSLFISNSFAVPGAVVSQIIEVGDARQTQLYCYRR